MDSEEELAATVVVYILERRQKEKNGRKVVLLWNLGSLEEMPLGFTTLYNLQHFVMSYKYLSSLQMQIKLSVSSCFLFMVAILPFLYQLYFYLVKQNFLYDHTENVWLTNSTPIHFNSLFKFKGKSLHQKIKCLNVLKLWFSMIIKKWSLKNDIV